MARENHAFARSNGPEIEIGTSVNQDIDFPPGELSQPGERQEENAAPTIESAIASTSLHTTTDTLNFLSRVANWPKQLSEEGSG